MVYFCGFIIMSLQQNIIVFPISCHMVGSITSEMALHYVRIWVYSAQRTIVIYGRIHVVCSLAYRV